MHAEPAEELAAVPASVTYPEAKTAGEWAVGSVFVLAAIGIVVLIALSIAGLLG